MLPFAADQSRFAARATILKEAEGSCFAPVRTGFQEQAL